MTALYPGKKRTGQVGQIRSTPKNEYKSMEILGNILCRTG
jgi:hypothetical protein